MSKIEELSAAVENGKSKLVPNLVQECLDEGDAPLDVLNHGMIDAMSVVGEKFKKNEIFVPEMLVAARAMKKGVDVLKPHLSGENDGKIGKMVMGTVYGDLHDIGKNLVIMMIESSGYEVVDLGIDVSIEKFVQAAEDPNVTVVGVSALLTTILVRANRAMTLGMTMRLLNISVSSHTRSLLIMVPIRMNTRAMRV